MEFEGLWLFFLLLCLANTEKFGSSKCKIGVDDFSLPTFCCLGI